MNSTSKRIPLSQTNTFSKVVLDYVESASSLQEFYTHTVSLEGMKEAMDARKENPVDRELLVRELKEQYKTVDDKEQVSRNIESLLSHNTFTITTAHQNNIFLGPLYFIYKTLHAIKIANYLKKEFPGQHFVPVFYIGSEDADLDELNHIHLEDKRLEWHTQQTGAVGRMKVDKKLLALIQEIEGQLGVFPHAAEIVTLFKKCYDEGTTIQQATFRLLHSLFANEGLVVLLPDNGALKEKMLPVFKSDLTEHLPSGIVAKTIEGLEQKAYKVQAQPRPINLFYLLGDVRERIEKVHNKWVVVNGEKEFTEEELITELSLHPERFSPNVILRGLYQETILPNIAFVGGGGELAYWLELKELFKHYKVPFPVLVLRNSFMIVEKKWQNKIDKLGFDTTAFFETELALLNKIVDRESKNTSTLGNALSEIDKLYTTVKEQAAAIDVSLVQHVEALKTQMIGRLAGLEKKMQRAERRKYQEQQKSIQAIKKALFPSGLQERYENFSYYYAKYGQSFIQSLYNHSSVLEQEFIIVEVE